MTASLVEAIDNMLAFVNPSGERGSEKLILDSSDERSKFEELDIALYVLATKAGLALPGKIESEHFSALGKVNVPYSSFIAQAGPGGQIIPNSSGIHIFPTDAWMTDMRALRALAVGNEDSEKINPMLWPDNQDVRDLIYHLQRNRAKMVSGKITAVDVARKFTGETKANDPKAQNLLRQAHRYSQFWKWDD